LSFAWPLVLKSGSMWVTVARSLTQPDRGGEAPPTSPPRSYTPSRLTFRGQHEHTLDSKDRLTIPARFRAALAEGVVLFEELDDCVSIYPPPAYEALTDRFVSSQSPLHAKGRMMRRRFHARAHDETLHGP